MSATGTSINTSVREVAADEIQTFREKGWVKLEQLISRQAAADLLVRARALMGETGDATKNTNIIRDIPYWQDYDRPSKIDPAFAAVARSRQLGRNAALLLGRISSIRLRGDLLAIKLPFHDRSDRGLPTLFHQDLDLPFDRSSLGFWIAMDEIRPDQGALQFYDGSHTLGNLGLHAPDLVELWPRLRECPLSAPVHLLPGDATAHVDRVVHGTAENATDRARWSYIAGYFPADTRYTNLPSPFTDGLGLKPFETLDHPSFPVVYDPNETA